MRRLRWAGKGWTISLMGVRVRKKGQTKGVFCVEGLWDPDLRVRSTVRPLLELLRLNEEVDYIRRECATREELEFYLAKWTQKRYDAYPILYIASHGETSGIQLGSDLYTVEALGDLLAGKCANRVVMFSACSTLHMDKRRLKSFLTKTEALAVCGYRVDVDWMRSTAFELILFARMQQNEFSGRGIEAIKRASVKTASAFPDLKFRMLTVKDLY
jgi:hypothetical protein